MMYGNMQSTRKYAVVKFKSDFTYSEIPAIWLLENDDGQWCLWPPRTANNATLISNYATPDYNTWGQYEVEIIKFCSSLESARQNAANYQTIDEEKFGKRKKQQVPCDRYIYSSEEEKCETSSQVYKRNKIKRCNVDDSTSTQNIGDLDIKQNIKRILRNQATANIMLKDINQRLTNIEIALKNRTNNVENYDDFIVNFLPLSTIENIKEFDMLLKTTGEAVTQFEKFISKIGGNNPKDNIHRTLKKIFTNECAMNCSWKGLRNNFRIVDLYITKLMRKVIISHNVSLTESEFDNVVAEWLRFAKQRKQRCDKATKNEGDNCIN